MRKFRGVEGGTPTGPPLCRTCQYAHYMQGERLSDLRLLCQVLPPRLQEMKQEMYVCSSYEDKRKATLDDMRKTAWYLRTDEFRNSIGFVSAKEWRKIRRAEEDDDFVGSL